MSEPTDPTGFGTTTSGTSGLSGMSSGVSGVSGMSSGMSGMSGMSGTEGMQDYDGDEVPEFIDDVEMGGLSSAQTGNEASSREGMDYADGQSHTTEVTSDNLLQDYPAEESSGSHGGIVGASESQSEPYHPDHSSLSEPQSTSVLQTTTTTDGGIVGNSSSYGHTTSGVSTSGSHSESQTGTHSQHDYTDETSETSSHAAEPPDIPDDQIELIWEENKEVYPVKEDWTYGDLRKTLKEADHDITALHDFYDDYTGEKLEDDERVTGGRRVAVRWHTFSIEVQDCDLMKNLVVASNWTIERIKEEVEQRHGRRIKSLSFQGREVPDQQQLRMLEILDDPVEKPVLVGMITVKVVDEACRIQTELHCLPFWTGEEFLNHYLDKSQRQRHDKYTLHFSENGHDRQLQDDMQIKLHDNGIRHASVLKYQVDPFTIVIYDHEENDDGRVKESGKIEGIELQVTDEETVKDIMENYAQQTNRFFNENDFLLMGTRRLEHELELWKLRMRMGEELSVQREEKAREMTYLCMNCGFDVKLKKDEPVQCHSCFQRILLKQRTTRVCQYNCR